MMRVGGFLPRWPAPLESAECRSAFLSRRISRGRIRTGTGVTPQGILSPQCLPFHHAARARPQPLSGKSMRSQSLFFWVWQSMFIQGSAGTVVAAVLAVPRVFRQKQCRAAWTIRLGLGYPQSSWHDKRPVDDGGTGAGFISVCRVDVRAIRSSVRAGKTSQLPG
jgi:hypothetical protein